MTIINTPLTGTVTLTGQKVNRTDATPLMSPATPVKPDNSPVIQIDDDDDIQPAIQPAERVYAPIKRERDSDDARIEALMRPKKQIKKPEGGKSTPKPKPVGGKSTPKSAPKVSNQLFEMALKVPPQLTHAAELKDELIKAGLAGGKKSLPSLLLCLVDDARAREMGEQLVAMLG